VHLFRGVRHRADLYDRHHLERMTARYPWLNLVRAVSDDPHFTEGEHGDVSDVVRRHGPWRDHDFFVSGSEPMVNATLQNLAEMQIPSTRIKYDAFTGA
jgi:NAD(P)H-flavin reductase